MGKKDSYTPTKVAIISLPKNDLRSPLIGPLIVAGHVKKNVDNVEVRLIDNTFEDVLSEVEKFDPEIIGLSTFTSYYQDTIDFAKMIRAKNPNIKIVIGGPHITTIPESFNEVFDCGVIGEGEKTMTKIVKAMMENKDFKKIDGIVFYDKGNLVINKRRKPSEIDEIFDIDYSLLNKNYFKRKFIPEKFDFGHSLHIMTSVGCPFNCRFCSIKICWEKIRYRKVDYIVKEIKELHEKYKVTHMDFLDDLFSINKERLRELIKKLEENNLLGKVSFSCQARSDVLDDEMCLILKKLNVKSLTFGFESGSDRILKYIKNNLNISTEHNRRAILLCKKYGLNIYGCLMIGMPGEKLEDMQKTIDFIDFGKRNGATRLWVQVLVPYPGTEIWEIAKKRGKIDNDFYKQKIHVQVKEKPLLLDKEIPYEEFLKKFKIIKKKCRFFVYETFVKTLLKKPMNFFYFLGETRYYLRRFIEFVRQ